MRALGHRTPSTLPQQRLSQLRRLLREARWGKLLVLLLVLLLLVVMPLGAALAAT